MIARRNFLKTSAGLMVLFSIPLVSGCSDDDGFQSSSAGKRLNAWVHVKDDGKIVIFAPADELGQGSKTALPLVVAEYMEAKWSDVEVEMSPANGQIYGNPEFGGQVFTAASTAVSGFYDILRMAGAETKRLLAWNAARKLNVPMTELSVSESVITHRSSGESLTFGEVAAFATIPDPALPELQARDLKKRSEFKLVGVDKARRDVHAKTMGTAKYSIDRDIPDMLVGTVVRTPVFGGQIKKANLSSAKRVKGVVRVLERGESVIVLAHDYRTAQQGAAELRIEWEPMGDVDSYSANEWLVKQKQMVDDPSISGAEWDVAGRQISLSDYDEESYSSYYYSDYIYHGQMEPGNAVANYEDGKIEVWAGTQAPEQSVRMIAAVTGLDAENVTFHRELVGGGFGRRTLESMDWIVDAAWATKKVGKPVKIIWSREHDFAQGWFKPMSVHKLQARKQKNGTLDDWHHRIAVQEPMVTAEKVFYEILGKQPLIAMNGADHKTYKFENKRVAHLDLQPGIRTYSVLGVGVTPNTFAIESFIDEVALDMKVDPAELRLKISKNDPRLKAVLDSVVSRSGYGSRALPSGQAFGLAFCDYHGSKIAGVGTVSVDRASGKIYVHNVTMAIDPGFALQPDNVIAQVEGSFTFGLSNALYEKIDIEMGEIKQSNFFDYNMIRMKDVPEYDVEIVESGAAPTGVGQTGAVLAAPIISNAIARLTGSRLRHMPFIPERVKEIV